jgi:uncharacterized membrane protein YqhA
MAKEAGKPAAKQEANPAPALAAASRLSGFGTAITWIILLPIIATFIAALALMIYGAIETWNFVYELFFTAHHLEHDEALLHAIEIVDLFLLATVVQVVSLGLYQLYINQELALPSWLKIRTLDDLKSKLVGVTVTVMSVYFLGQAVVWTGGDDIAFLGGGIAAVIAALTYFLSTIDKSH